MTNRYFVLLLPLFFIAACKSPGKAFNQGYYNDAIDRAVRKLQKDPGDAESRKIAQAAYTYAVRQYDDKIRAIAATSAESRWEQLYFQYSQLQRLYDKIYESPAAVQAVKPSNYSSYVATYRDKAAGVHQQRARSLMDVAGAGRNDFKEAFYEIRTALNFKPNDAGLVQMLQDARAAATVNVLLVTRDVNSAYRYNTSYAFRNFEADLVRNIRSSINNDFLYFMTLPDAQVNGLLPDETAEMRLGAFNIGRPFDESKTRTVTKDVVVKEKVYSKDSVVKEYAKVKARITTTRRIVISTADLYMEVRNAGSLILWNDVARAEHRWTTEFSTYTGDERALSDEDKALLNKKAQVPPQQDAVVDYLMRQLAVNATQRLRTYYDRY